MNEYSKTVVVYGSQLNFRTVNPYLDSLMMNGHIFIIDEKMPRYKTTEKGMELLAIIKKAHEIVYLSCNGLSISHRVEDCL